MNPEPVTPAPNQASEPISEPSIARLVDSFYAKVRQDSELGPIFNNAVGNWDAHLDLLRDFWSSVLLGTAKYKGNPLLAHFPLDLDELHFSRWLALFSETAREILRPEEAALVIDKAEKIAANIRRMIALRDQQLTGNALPIAPNRKP